MTEFAAWGAFFILATAEAVVCAGGGGEEENKQNPELSLAPVALGKHGDVSKEKADSCNDLMERRNYPHVVELTKCAAVQCVLSHTQGCATMATASC